MSAGLGLNPFLEAVQAASLPAPVEVNRGDDDIPYRARWLTPGGPAIMIEWGGARENPSYSCPVFLVGHEDIFMRCTPQALVLFLRMALGWEGWEHF